MAALNPNTDLQQTNINFSVQGNSWSELSLEFPQVQLDPKCFDMTQANFCFAAFVSQAPNQYTALPCSFALLPTPIFLASDKLPVPLLSIFETQKSPPIQIQFLH